MRQVSGIIGFSNMLNTSGSELEAQRLLGFGRELSLVVCFLMVLAVFSPILSAVVHPFFDYIDEVLAVFVSAVLGAASFVRLRVGKTVLVYLMLAIVVVLCSVLFGRNNNIVHVFVQIFLQSKFFIFMFSAAYIMRARDAAATLRLIFYLSVLGVFLNILMPDYFQQAGLMDRSRDLLLEIDRVGGFQLNPNRLSHLIALLPLVSRASLRASGKVYFVLLVVSFLIIAATGGRVGLALFAMSCGIRLYISSKDMAKTAYSVFVFPLVTLFVLIYFGNQFLFESVFGRESELGLGTFRLLLLVEAFKLAIDYFPFGSGAATYGTIFAYDVGVYQETAIASTFFYKADTALYDNNFASLLGELGFVGFVFVVYAIWKTLYIFRDFLRKEIWVGVVVFVVFSLFFESFLSNSICGISLSIFLASEKKSLGYS